jgi:hypothetical protein
VWGDKLYALSPLKKRHIKNLVIQKFFSTFIFYHSIQVRKQIWRFKILFVYSGIRKNEVMKVFELKDKNNKSTNLFKIENYTSKEEVMNKLNSIFSLNSDCTNKNEGLFNYVYVADDGFCRFVESLTEFSEDYQTEEAWQVCSSVEVK